MLAILNFCVGGKLLMGLLWLLAVFPAASVAMEPTLEAIDAQLQVTLSDGTQFRLAGIQPLGAKTALPANWQNAPLHVEVTGRNRYGQPVAWLRRQSDGQLLQNALLQNGAALAYWHQNLVLPDDFNTKQQLPRKAVFDAENARQALDQWAVIEGTIYEVAILKSAAYLNFAENWKEDFTIYLPKATMRQFDETALGDLKSKRVRVRGFVHSYYGPRITLLNPEMLEVIP